MDWWLFFCLALRHMWQPTLMLFALFAVLFLLSLGLVKLFKFNNVRIPSADISDEKWYRLFHAYIKLNAKKTSFLTVVTVWLSLPIWLPVTDMVSELVFYEYHATISARATDDADILDPEVTLDYENTPPPGYTTSNHGTTPSPPVDETHTQDPEPEPEELPVVAAVLSQDNDSDFIGNWIFLERTIDRFPSYELFIDSFYDRSGLNSSMVRDRAEEMRSSEAERTAALVIYILGENQVTDEQVREHIAGEFPYIDNIASTLLIRRINSNRWAVFSSESPDLELPIHIIPQVLLGLTPRAQNTEGRWLTDLGATVFISLHDYHIFWLEAREVPVTGISLIDRDAGNLPVSGRTLEIEFPKFSPRVSAIITPEYATDRTVEWYISSGTDIVSIQEVGNNTIYIHAHHPGTAVVTATTTDGGVSASVNIYVHNFLAGFY